MGIKQAFSLAIKSLMTSKMCSFLTMLGIIIGVGAVIILVSLVNGFKSDMLSTFEDMGLNLINVNITARGSNRQVDVEDMYLFAEENSDYIQYISPKVTLQAYPKFGAKTAESTSVTGVNEDYIYIQNYNLSSGRFIQYMDVQTRQKSCVIGSYLANEYFDGNAVGKTFKINGNPFLVVGVLEEQADSSEGSSDDCIYIPYTLARTVSHIGTVSSYVVYSTDKELVDETITMIENYLYGIFSSDSAYRVMALAQIADMVNELLGTLTIILVGIAGISLLVGGIGIMNIMLVSVTERTREIGIRKSIGAKRSAIMSQFVVEAATTSAIGGVIGIIFGIAASVVVCRLMGIGVSISITSIIVAFGVSAGIGVMFGYFPASKASKLNPIEALRHD